MVSAQQLRGEPSTGDSLEALSVYDASSLKSPVRLLYPVITFKNLNEIISNILPFLLPAVNDFFDVF